MEYPEIQNWRRLLISKIQSLREAPSDLAVLCFLFHTAVKPRLATSRDQRSILPKIVVRERNVFGVEHEVKECNGSSVMLAKIRSLSLPTLSHSYANKVRMTRDWV